MFHLSGISKGFGGRTILAQATLQLPHRAVVGLVGPNGSGKTTLLRMLAGETEPDTGAIITTGGVRIGTVGQEVTLTDHGTVLQTVLAGLPTVELLEEKLVALGEQLEGMDPESELHQSLIEEIATVQTEHDLFDSSRLEPRARKLLDGLGIDLRQQNAGFSELSGGWQMRIVLARVLLTQPQVLLLDEPTNHLDIDALIWLEQFLVGYDGLVVMTSHDRTFLDRAISHVLAIEDCGLWFEPGHYSAYLHHRTQRREQLEMLRNRQLAEKEKLEKFVARFQAKATKARQAQSRKKQLEKMVDVKVIELPSPPPAIYFADPPPTPKIMLEVHELEKQYDGPPLFSDLEWTVQRGTKAALVGPNGSGKSTLLQILAGEIEPTTGSAQFGPRAQFGYFAQDQGERLPGDMTPLTWMMKQHGTMSPGIARNLLGRYRFGGSLAEQKIHTLSGGEKARLYLAHLAACEINFLLLDEPTNHLDIESREALAKALKKWPGDMLVVSHDRAFLNTFVDTVVDLHQGEVKIYPGTMKAYEERLRTRREAPKNAARVPDSETTPTKKPSSKAQTKTGGNLWKERKKIQANFRKATRALEQTESQVDTLKKSLTDPALASDHQELLRLQKELDRGRVAADRAMTFWEQCVKAGEKAGLDLLEAG